MKYFKYFENICNEQMEITIKEKTYKISFKTMGTISGFEAYLLILYGGIYLTTDFYYSLLTLFYGFFILLPLSYYSMKNHKISVGKI